MWRLDFNARYAYYLQCAAQVISEVAVIETAGISVPGCDDHELVGFYADDALNSDYGNWFAPSAQALVGMCRAAGFRRAEVTASTAPAPAKPRRGRQPTRPVECRIVARAYP